MSAFEIDVQRACDAAAMPSEQRITHWARSVLERYRDAAALSVRLVDENEGASLNATYRRGTGATNVLSFPFEAAQLTDPPLLGDLVICAPVVEREATAQGKTAAAHYAHMIVHGVLHLLGHDHEMPHEAERMERLERDHLRELGFDDPYLQMPARVAGDE